MGVYSSSAPGRLVRSGERDAAGRALARLDADDLTVLDEEHAFAGDRVGRAARRDATRGVEQRGRLEDRARREQDESGKSMAARGRGARDAPGCQAAVRDGPAAVRHHTPVHSGSTALPLRASSSARESPKKKRVSAAASSFEANR